MYQRFLARHIVINIIIGDLYRINNDKFLLNSAVFPRMIMLLAIYISRNDNVSCQSICMFNR